VEKSDVYLKISMQLFLLKINIYHEIDKTQNFENVLVNLYALNSMIYFDIFILTMIFI